MSRFMVAGFVQIETIVKVSELPVPYKQFFSAPDLINTNTGGAGYNEAVALSWLGNEVDFMSMIGKNISKAQYTEQLKCDGINLNLDYVLPRLEDMPTSVTLYANGKKQTFEDVKDIRTVEYDIDIFEQQIQDKDMVVVSSCNFCKPLIGLAKKYNKPLAVNVRSLHNDKALQREDFLKAADILYVSKDGIDQDPYVFINECREKYNPEIIIVGTGSSGVVVYSRNDNSVLDYKPVKTNEIVNTTGAGNALFSAFLHYYLKTKDANLSIYNALLFASYKIGFVGTSIGFLTEEQIEQWRALIWPK